MQSPPLLNGKPTQAPLNREQQKMAYEALKSEYFKETPAMPQMAQPVIKEYKLTEAEQLRAVQAQMKERGMNSAVQVVEERLEEKKVEDTIKTFYCRHTFQKINARWSFFPITCKICSKCGLVK
jgi:hypothetical protein